MFITMKLLKEANACSSGRNWFKQHFPEGGDHDDVIKTAFETEDGDYAMWGIDKIYRRYHKAAAFIKSEALAAKRATTASGGRVGGVEAIQATNAPVDLAGYDTCAIAGASTVINIAGHLTYTSIAVNGAFIRAHGTGHKIALVETDNIVAASGSNVNIVSANVDNIICTTGADNKIALTGGANCVTALGPQSVIVSAGTGTEFTLGPDGCAAIPYYDKHNKLRFAVAYVGENGIEPNTQYRVKRDGTFETCED